MISGPRFAPLRHLHYLLIAKLFPSRCSKLLGCGLPALITDKVNIWSYVQQAQAGFVDWRHSRRNRLLLKEVGWPSRCGTRPDVQANALRCFAQNFDADRIPNDFSPGWNVTACIQKPNERRIKARSGDSCRGRRSRARSSRGRWRALRSGHFLARLSGRASRVHRKNRCSSGSSVTSLRAKPGLTSARTMATRLWRSAVWSGRRPRVRLRTGCAHGPLRRPHTETE